MAVGEENLNPRPRLFEYPGGNMAKVSVIIATRNRGALLPRAVESARRASSDAEIVVVDDASEDQTREVCERWTDVVYLRAKRRLGLGAARNVGLIASTAPYITFLDDDDLRLPGSLDAQIELLEAQSDAGLIYCKALYGDEAGNANGSSYPEQCRQGDVFWELLRGNFIPCPTVVFRRACLTRVGLLEEDAPGIEDWDLWVRIAELYSVIAIDQTVAIWRRGMPASGQFTSHAEKLHREARRLHRDKWLRLPRAIEAGGARRRKAARDFAARASQELVWEAASRLKAGRVFASAGVALAGARMYPLGVSKKLLSPSTLRSLISSAEHYWRAERI
jgi:glycosyltransferase involved in cell wall biosynthesis